MNKAQFLEHNIFKTIGAAADELGLETYVIGGFVRDKMLNRQTEKKDIDVVTVGSGIDLAKKVASLLPGKSNLSVFKRYGTAQVKVGELELEFVGARKESYSEDSRNPAVENGTLQDDQNRRDFTINALAIGLNKNNWGEVLDPFNGVEDMENSCLKTPLDPDITYSDDPLRMLRAIRFATQLNFIIEKESLNAIARNVQRIDIISKERIHTELNKILAADAPSVGFELLFSTGLLHRIMPDLVKLQGVEEVEGQLHKDNFYHTLEVVDNIAKMSDNVWLRWAGLLHDIAKPRCKRFVPKVGWTFHGHEFRGAKMVPGIFKSLKMPLNDKMDFVAKMVRLSSRPISLIDDGVSDSAVRRLLFEAGDDIDDLMTLCNADITTKNEKRKKRYRNNFKVVKKKFLELEEKDHLRNFQPPISGQVIMETFNLKPGIEVGRLKNAIREAILDGKIGNNQDEAMAFMIKRAQKIGLQKID